MGESKTKGQHGGREFESNPREGDKAQEPLFNFEIIEFHYVQSFIYLSCSLQLIRCIIEFYNVQFHCN